MVNKTMKQLVKEEIVKLKRLEKSDFYAYREKAKELRIKQETRLKNLK